MYARFLFCSIYWGLKKIKKLLAQVCGSGPMGTLSRERRGWGWRRGRAEGCSHCLPPFLWCRNPGFLAPATGQEDRRWVLRPPQSPRALGGASLSSCPVGVGTRRLTQTHVRNAPSQLRKHGSRSKHVKRGESGTRKGQSFPPLIWMSPVRCQLPMVLIHDGWFLPVFKGASGQASQA